jgi:hypothetical protein
MSDPADSYDAEASITAILDGGPADFPASLRSTTVSRLERKVKVRYLNGYEHFERTEDEAEDCAAVVRFRWSMRTRIAE